MANRYRGDYEFAVDGQSYTVRLGTGTLAQIERELKKSVTDILRELMGSPSILSARTILCVALSRGFPGCPPLAMDKAEMAVDAIAPVELLKFASEAFNVAFTGSAEGDDSGTSENPPQPGRSSNGTGPGSTQAG